MIASLFGATGQVSAFRAANTVLTMVYELCIGGPMNSTLVTVLSDYITPGWSKELSRLISIIMSWTLVILITLLILLEVFAPRIARVLVAGFDSRLQMQTARLLRVMAPALIFLSLSTIISGLLYAARRFTYPAFVGAAFNAGVILGAFLGVRRWGIASLAGGTLLGAMLQVLIQLPGLRGLRLRFMLNVRHPALQRIAALHLPVALGLVISNLQAIIERNLASHTGNQSIAWMSAAMAVIQAPLSLVIVAISMASLPTLARQSGSADLDSFRRTLGASLRLVLTVIIPLTVWLWVLARPIVTILYQRGAFTSTDTAQTVLMLRLYLFGLPCAAIDQLLISAFYAHKDTRTPALVGVLAAGVYLAVALVLIYPLGIAGLAIATSAQWASHAAVMLRLLHQRVDGLCKQRLIQTAGRAGLVTVIMIGVWLAVRWTVGRAWFRSPWGDVISGSAMTGLTVFLITAQGTW